MPDPTPTDRDHADGYEAERLRGAIHAAIRRHARRVSCGVKAEAHIDERLVEEIASSLPRPADLAQARQEGREEGREEGIREALKLVAAERKRALARAAQAEAEVVELRGVLELIARQDTFSPGGEYMQIARRALRSSPSPTAESLGRVVEAAERRVDAMRMGLGGDVPDRDLAEAVDALQAARAGRGEGERWMI